MAIDFRGQQFFPEPKIFGSEREVLAGSTDWRHLRPRLSGRSASTTPDDRQATRSGAGQGCTAGCVAEARSGEGALLPWGVGGSRCESAVEHGGSGPGPPSQSHAGRGRAGQGGGAAGLESPVQPPAWPHPAGENGGWGGWGGSGWRVTERRSARAYRRVGASDSASPVRRARRPPRARRMEDRRAGRLDAPWPEGLGTAVMRPGPRSRG